MHKCEGSGNITDEHIIVYCPAFLKCITQSAFSCSKLTKETIEQGVKYVQS